MTPAAVSAAPRAPVAPTAPAPPVPSLSAVLRAKFTGSGGEYFGIYYTNAFLSAITLGIYSAWAKVRNLRYFYGHTYLLNSTFDFDARGLMILVSRLVVLLAAGMILWIESTLGIDQALVFGFSGWTFFMLLPIMTVRGRAFNWRHTLWRGVRFSYTKRYLPSYAHLCLITIPQLIAVLMLVAVFEDSADNPLRGLLDPTYLPHQLLTGFFAAHLVLVWPIGTWWRHRIRINQLTFGKLKFRFCAPPAAYVRNYIVHIVVLLLLWGGFGWFTLADYDGSSNLFYGVVNYELYAYLVGAAVIVTFIMLLSFAGHIARLYWNGIITTEGSRIQASFSPVTYAFYIVVINFFLKLFSFGLLTPFARVRKWRYLIKHITIHPSPELRTVLADADSFETAVATELLELEGFDFDFGMI